MTDFHRILRGQVPQIWTRGDQWSIGVVTLLLTVAIGFWHWKQTGSFVPLRNANAVSPRPVSYQLHWKSATWPELTLISGIGETLARRIIARREEAGILTRQELADVHGIGDVKLAALLRHLTVAAPSRRTAD